MIFIYKEELLTDSNTLRLYENEYYDMFDRGTYSTSLVEALKLIPTSVNQILEVGCGTGEFGALIKKVDANRHVSGVEFHPRALTKAKENLDQVYPLDLQSHFSEQLPTQAFDCITILDILEHVVEPAFTFKQLLPALKPDGCIIFSIPNVRWQNVVLNLVFNGYWGDGNGVIAAQHLRFFALKNIMEFLIQFGLHFDSQIVSVGVPELNPELLPILDILENKGLPRQQTQLEFQTFQYVFRATLREQPIPELGFSYNHNRADWTFKEIQQYLKS